MKLSDSDTKYIIDQIAYYYDDEQKLITIFTLNQEIFENGFYIKLKGNDYYTKIVNLVIGLINKNKLHNFVLICRNEYSDFCQDIYQNILLCAKEKLEEELAVSISKNSISKNTEEQLEMIEKLINPKNQQELKIDESLLYIDFEEAIKILDHLQPQFMKEVYLALFFIDDYNNKKGDLYLERLKKKCNENPRHPFRHFLVEYKLDSLEDIIREISRYLDIKENELTIKLVTQEIAKLLQRNATILIEIRVDNDQEDEIDTLVNWFINEFWKLLRQEIEKATKNLKYTNIKVFGFINSTLEFKKEYFENNLSSCFYDDCTCFKLDKLLKVPLKDWEQRDIEKWLINYSEIDDEEIEKKASAIFTKSRSGIPEKVCDILQQQWRTLIYPTS